MNPGSQKGIRIAMAGLGLLCLILLAVALVGLNLPPVMVLAVIIGGIALPVFVLRPEAGLHLFLFITIFEAMGEANQSLTVSKLAGALILGGWLLSVAVSRRISQTLNAQVLALGAFVGVAALSIMQAHDNQVAVRQTLTYLQLLVVMLMVGSVVRTPEAVQRVLRTLVFAMTLAATHGFLQYALGHANNTAGFIGNRNLMATYLAFAIPCAYILYLGSRSGLVRLGLLISLTIQFVALALTFSRTGMITLAVVIPVLGFHLARQHGFRILIATSLLIVISFGLPEAFYKRLGTIASSVRRQEETFGQRMQLTSAGMRMIAEHPVLGVGAGNYPIVLPYYGRSGYLLSGQWASHNTYVGVAAENGIPSLLLLLLVVGAAFKSLQAAIRAGRVTDPKTALLAVAVHASLVAFMVSALSGNFEKNKYLFVFLGLALSLDGIRQRQAAATAAAERRLPAAPPLEATLAGAP